MTRSGRPFMSGLSIILTMIMLIFQYGPVLGASTVLDEAKSIVKQNYVDPVSSDLLAAPTIDSMIKRLGDPYASYYTNEEFQEELDALNGEFTGIGIYFRPVKGGVQVFQLVQGSPAMRMGIIEGDIITRAADQNLDGLDVDAVGKLIKGPADTTVKLRIKRGSAALDISVKREKVAVPTVESQLLENRTAYIALYEFGSHTADDMKRAIQDLSAKKAENWILDLRGNPGGFLESAIDIAGCFVGGADVVAVQERKDREVYQGTLGGVYFEGPLVVLIDENSASAAEILSAALQDNQRALIIGHKSYGKGTVQQIFDLSNGDKIKFTVARFYSPLGKTINKTGVEPDIAVADDQAELAAQLVLYDPPKNYTGPLIRIDTESFEIEINPKSANSARFWPAWRNIITAGNGRLQFYTGNDTQGWNEVSSKDCQALWPLFYPGYKDMGVLEYSQSAMRLEFLKGINPVYLNSANINLINAVSGERIPLQFTSNADNQVLAKPSKNLAAGEYWMVVDNTFLQFNDGQKLDKGLLARIKVSP